MEEPQQSIMSKNEHHRPVWSLKKIGLTVLFSAILFAAGLVVGRGNVHIPGLSPTVAKATGSLDYSSVNQVYDILKQNYDGNLNSNSLIDGAKEGLVAATGDPYTEYFNPADAKTFNDELSGSITGIGAELGSQNGNVVIISPLAGFPAEKAGLQPKDIVGAVDGKATTGMSVDSVVSEIRGKEGTKVTLTLVRNGGNPFNVTITRQKITVPSVNCSEDSDIGDMKVSQFTADTSDLAAKCAQEFKSKNVKAVVLDLRGDPGGYLTAAVNLSSLWLEQGKTIVTERRGATIVSTETATGNNILKGLPTVVLIDGGSASASEITAGALHDNGAATLMGQQSFGKGSVQQVQNLPDGSEMKVTVAHWYTPNGININKKGITPDKVVSNDGANAVSGTDPQKAAAEDLLTQKLQ